MAEKKMPSKKQIAAFKKQGQYPRKTKNWIRYRQKGPEAFVKKSFRNVPLSHTGYKGKIKGQRAIVGKLKKTRKWVIQSILRKRKFKKKG